MSIDTTITCLRTHQLVVPWSTEPPNNGIMPPASRQFLILELETKGGLTGMGYLMPLSGGLATLDACMADMIAPKILGRDATEIEAIWQTLWRGNYWLGRMGIAVFCQSAVDVALWDIMGKRCGLPLYRLWGSNRKEVAAYGSGVWRGLDRDVMIARARHFTGQGLRAIKMQCAHIRPWREDVKNVAAMREALGPDIEIMMDVNMGWTADVAIQAGHHFDDYDLYWLEEPVVCEDIAGYRRVAQQLKTRVVGGETHYTRYELRPFFEQPSSPILQPDPMRGGLTELRKIAATADTWGLQMAPHLFHELMVHLMCSISNPSYLEYMDWNDDLWVEPVLPDARGMMRPLEHPGHGLRLKPELFRDHRVGGQEIRA